MRDGSKTQAQTTRADRLAEALRENLKRRKTQSRKRRETAAESDDETAKRTVENTDTAEE